MFSPGGRSSVSIRDVAKRADVSLATVSRVLNDTGLVREDTARLVLDAAADLGFRLNHVGRSLRATQTRNIGVMLPTIAHPVFAECLQALEDTAQAASYSLSIATTNYDPANEDRASEALLSRRVDGLILTVADATRSKLLEKLDREGMPYVLVYNQPSGKVKHRPNVAVDNRRAARDITEYLIACGHRRICMIAGAFRQSDRARQRARGFRDAITGADLEAFEPIEVDFVYADLHTPLGELIATTKRPTALFCSSDQLALRVMHALHALCVDVPHDISVVGFDGIEMGQWMQPSLCTVVQPTREIAAAAFDLLARLIRGEHVPGATILSHSLREGASVSSPRETVALAAFCSSSCTS
jgi:DNA-binding LacI/PurR family transcriptional regulator